MVRLNFNANEYEEYTPIPNGDYEGWIIKAGLSERNPEALELVWEITSGPYTGRKIYMNHLIFSSDPKRANGAKYYFSPVCRACGVLNVEDSSELLRIPCRIRVSTDTYSYNGQDRAKNTITQYEKLEIQPPAAPSMPQPPAGQMPWTAAAVTDKKDDVPF